MPPFDNELDKDSAAGSESSSDHEQDATQEDREDPELDGDVDADADGDQDGEEEDDDNGEEDEERPDSQVSFSGRKAKTEADGLSASSQSPAKSTGDGLKPSTTAGPTSTPNPALTSANSPNHSSAIINDYSYDYPKVRPEAISASVYDVVPTIAAPHSTSINAVAATPDLRWVFSGGADGYIRRYNWIETANGKALLTVAQRHPFVDSVTKAGVLMNYWENSEDDSGAYNPHKITSTVY